MSKSRLNLTGVPETMLWPLYNRACEQKRKDRILDDPMALELTEQIDYNFQCFGRFNPGHPLRSYAFDEAIKQWLKEYPEGTIISLGEGLDTQFWRIDNGKLRWISVDVAEAIDVRTRFLPPNERLKHIPCSALDNKWINEIAPNTPVFIVLAGVIMYFTEAEAKTLLCNIANHFRQCEILFDMIPEWYSRKTMKGMKVTKTYQAPLMPYGMNYGDYQQLSELSPGLKIRKHYTYPDINPKRMRPYSYFRNIKWIRDKMAPWIIQLSKK